MRLVLKLIMATVISASPLMAQNKPNKLTLECDPNIYNLNRKTMMAEACEMFRGVFYCSEGVITYWDDEHIAWIQGSEEFPTVTGYGINTLTPYGKATQRLLLRVFQDLRHSPKKWQDDKGVLAKTRTRGFACTIKETLF